MTGTLTSLWPWWAAIAMVSVAGLYALLVTRNLLRVLMGLELLTKAVTLLLVLAGYATGRALFTQSLVITLIVVEVVVIAVAAGLVVNVHRVHGSLDAGALTGTED